MAYWLRKIEITNENFEKLECLDKELQDMDEMPEGVDGETDEGKYYLEEIRAQLEGILVRTDEMFPEEPSAYNLVIGGPFHYDQPYDDE